MDQLVLDLRDAGEQLVAAATRYADLSQQVYARATENAMAPAASSEVSKNQREVLRRVVGQLARRTGGDWREAWSLVYDELQRQTGYHPSVDLVEANGSHLDAVCARGYFDRALDAGRQLLGLVPPPPRPVAV